MSRTRKIVLFWMAAAFVAAVEAVLAANWLVGKTSSRIYTSVQDIPAREVGMVLGTSMYSGGRPNPVLTGRLQAAADLYHAGKVRRLIVTGATYPEDLYDEITYMTQGLIARELNPDDSRSLRVILTPAADAIRDEVLAASNQLNEEFMGGFTPEERERVFAGLRRIGSTEEI